MRGRRTDRGVARRWRPRGGAAGTLYWTVEIHSSLNSRGALHPDRKTPYLVHSQFRFPIYRISARVERRIRVMPEKSTHRRAKNRAAGPGGRTEVPLRGKQRLDALTKGGGRATEVERSGSSAGLNAAAQRLKKERGAAKGSAGSAERHGRCGQGHAEVGDWRNCEEYGRHETLACSSAGEVVLSSG